jgi:arsenate reductase
MLRAGGHESRMSGIYNILFLCTGNSARSIIAEALVNHIASERFHAYSAGSFPKGEVHPLGIEALADRGIPTEGLRSKSWDEFASPSAPQMDIIITVCDDAAGETCPIWPGKPLTAHWGIEDPAKADGAKQRQAFENAATYLKARISLLMALPLEAIDELALETRLKAIGKIEGATGRVHA